MALWSLTLLLAVGCEPAQHRKEPTHLPAKLLLVADSSLREPLNEIERDIENSDSTLRFSVTFASHDEMRAAADSGRFDLLLYTDTGNDPQLIRGSEDSTYGPDQTMLVAGEPLVVVVAHDSRLPLISIRDLAALPSTRIAILEQPALEARLAEEALGRNGLWRTLEHRRLLARDSRDVIDMITDARADAGIIRGSEARRFDARVRIVDTLRSPSPTADPGINPYIRYRIAALSHLQDNTAARRLLEQFIHPDNQRIFSHYGFTRRDSMLPREMRRAK